MFFCKKSTNKRNIIVNNNISESTPLRIALRLASFNLALRLLLFGVGRLHEQNIFTKSNEQRSAPCLSFLNLVLMVSNLFDGRSYTLTNEMNR